MKEEQKFAQRMYNRYKIDSPITISKAKEYENKDKKDEAFECYYLLSQEESSYESSYAEYNLGICYENGFGIEKDEKETFQWYR